ncbi:phasin family protein [Inquilinus sp. OTU3971]|uniref:phasin family protein n=1 Tax=Inquilinus sp. OTU3971 TaxID=3043855 RepID=UPI00313E05C2
MSKQDDTAAGMAVALSALFPFTSSATNAVVQAGKPYVQASLEWQEELVGFVSARLREDLELHKSIAGSRNIADVIKLQQDWVTASMRAYLDEGGKLAEIARHAASNGVALLYETAQSSLGQGAPQGSGKATRTSIAAE